MKFKPESQAEFFRMPDDIFAKFCRRIQLVKSKEDPAIDDLWKWFDNCISDAVNKGYIIP